MNKTELIDHIAESAGIKKSEAEAALNSMLEGVKAAVASGDKVTIPGFGAWSRTDRKARVGRNPQTGAPVQIAASKGVKFTAGAGFKSAVN